MALKKIEYVDGVTIIEAKNLNEIQDEIISLNNTKMNNVIVSETAPINPKVGDLWLDTTEQMPLPSLMETAEFIIPIEGYIDNKIIVIIEGILNDDFAIADLRTKDLTIEEKQAVLEEFGKVLEMNTVKNGIEVIVSEVPLIEIPMKVAVIHK